MWCDYQKYYNGILTQVTGLVHNKLLNRKNMTTPSHWSLVYQHGNNTEAHEQLASILSRPTSETSNAYINTTVYMYNVHKSDKYFCAMYIYDSLACTQNYCITVQNKSVYRPWYRPRIRRENEFISKYRGAPKIPPFQRILPVLWFIWSSFRSYKTYYYSMYVYFFFNVAFIVLIQSNIFMYIVVEQTLYGW